MDPKQGQIEQLVIQYFRQREDIDVSLDAGGRYRLRFRSDIARTNFGRGQSDQLTLVFDPDQAYRFAGSELITANHPYLDVIRNDLERLEEQDPRLGEAHIALQVIDPKGAVRIPRLEFLGSSNCQVDHRIRYRPTVILTYRVVYDMEGGSEDLVHLCFDAVSGSLRADLLIAFQQTLWVSGRPSNVDINQCLDIDRILQDGREEIEKRIAADLNQLGRALQEELDVEILRINENYQNELNLLHQDSPDFGELKALLVTNRDREIEEWERKLSCRAKIQLLSCLRLWWPSVDYTIVVPSSRGEFTLDEIQYCSESNTTTFFRCEECGNERQYVICVSGEHALCAGGCAHETKSCATCHDDFCTHHGCLCGSCGAPVCQSDRETCQYGHHASDQYYCPNCHVSSFEGKVLCTECRETCELCERDFPHERMSTCRLGGERFCQGHDREPDGAICVECGEASCRQHGRITQDGSWACTDHIETATCCDEVYPRSRLRACASDPDERLCHLHSVFCVGCGKAICNQHRHPLHQHRDRFVCESCRHTCVDCPAEKSYLDADLTKCHICGELICNAHREICVVGGEPLCQTDVQKSADGEPLCPTHVGYCVQTGSGPGKPIHRTDHLLTCIVCRGTVCEAHRSVCQVCSKTVMCTVHEGTQPSCESCGRVSCEYNECSPSSHKCRYCGMAYCRHCMRGDHVCTTCSSLKEFGANQKWITYLMQIAKRPGSAGAVLASILQYPEQLSWYSAKNRSYSVIVVRFQPRFWEIWKEVKQVRVVLKNDGSSVRVIPEKARR